MISGEYSDYSIYTIIDPMKLAKYQGSGGKGSFTTNRPWVYAKKLLDKKRNKNIAVFFADARQISNVIACASIGDIKISGDKSEVHIEDLFFIRNGPAIERLKKRDGSALDRNYRRGYAIIATPNLKKWKPGSIADVSRYFTFLLNPAEEGMRRLVEGYRFERNASLKTACLSHYGNKCQVCEMTFEGNYGASFQEVFVHVHHLKPLNVGKRKTDPIKDLVPVCPNCHAAIHMRKKPYSVEEMKSFYRKRRS